MSKTSPTQRSLAHMRKQGYVATVTERWNAFAKIRQDLFGICDVLCLRDGETVAVQCTSDSGGNMSSRVNKIAEHENTPHIRKAGWRIVVQGWRKKGAHWQVREVDCS